VDLVRLQVRIAEGEPLPFRQEDLTPAGHAIEIRITAEDPSTGFLPETGTIEALRLPQGPGVRVDSHLFSGYQIPPNYDSLVAKIIAHGATREEAISIMKRALHETIIEGVRTTIPLHRRLLDDSEFKSGRVGTSFLESRLKPLLGDDPGPARGI